MKKTLFTMVMSFIAIFLIASSAHAAMPTLTVTNASTQPCSAGAQDGCWKTNTTARPGDVIAVHLYYANTSSQPQNATAVINPSRTGTNVSFSGGINNSTVARVTLSEPTTIVYMIGSNAACFKPSGSSACRSVDSSALFGGGADLGTINPGEEFTVVARFLVDGASTPAPIRYQCNDGIDNDSDGLIDYPSDPGCSSSTDNDEYNAPQPIRYQCNDGIDNDSDGLIDYPSDPGCSSSTDNSEYNAPQPIRYQCNDGIDNDSDGLIDYPSDPGCSSSTDNSEYNTVTPPNTNYCHVNSFTVDARNSITITEGDSALLRWNTTDCDYVRVTGFSGNLDADSTATVRPSSDRTYTLTAYPNGGSATVRVNVQGDTTNNNNDACAIDSFKLSRSSIDRGQTATLSWNASGVNRVEINGSSKNSNSSMSVSPNVSFSYTIEVWGNGCYDSRTVRLSVNEQNDSRPQAITTIASIFGSTSAQLNGIAVPNSTVSTSAWFEWGASSSLGYRTSSKIINSNSSTPYSDIVNGLVPGTTYYYRAVVQNQNGTAYGDIISFRTQNTVAGTVVVRQPTRVVVQTIRDSVTAESTPSLLELRIESAYDHMCIGGEIEYVVTYRNISTLTLEDTVLRLALPKELTYSGANRGSYDAIDRIITLDIGRMQPGEEGAVTVRARVNDMAIRNNLTVMTATVVYTNPLTRAQEDAIAYSLITVSDECPTVLGASVFGFGSFLPDTLLEWLLLILVILALILIGRNLYKKKEEQK